MQWFGSYRICGEDLKLFDPKPENDLTITIFQNYLSITLTSPFSPPKDVKFQYEGQLITGKLLKQSHVWCMLNTLTRLH